MGNINPPGIKDSNGKSTINIYKRGFKRNIIYKCWIFNCHVKVILEWNEGDRICRKTASEVMSLDETKDNK